jgi:hypothetical protein
VGTSEIDGFAEREDAELLAIVANDTDLTRADFSVYSDERTGRRTGRERAAQDTLDG